MHSPAARTTCSSKSTISPRVRPPKASKSQIRPACGLGYPSMAYLASMCAAGNRRRLANRPGHPHTHRIANRTFKFLQHRWLHGKINRFQAEERLKTFNQPGCYLVRESDRLQTTFVLSYLDKKGSINHFQIKAYYGDYYIAGER